MGNSRASARCRERAKIEEVDDESKEQEFWVTTRFVITLLLWWGLEHRRGEGKQQCNAALELVLHMSLPLAFLSQFNAVAELQASRLLCGHGLGNDRDSKAWCSCVMDLFSKYTDAAMPGSSPQSAISLFLSLLWGNRGECVTCLRALWTFFG